MLTLLIVVQAVEAQPYYTPKEIVFTVYADGIVAVDYNAEVDPTRARVNLTLFGSLYQDLTVLDQDGLPLDYYSSVKGVITVDTLGSTSVFIYYLTPDLTGKSAHIWVFSVSTPVSSSILLPDGSTIVGLNVVPLALGILDGGPLLTMPIGEVEVTYTIGIVGTREHALALIKDAESTIETIRGRGVVATEAEDLLQQAYAAFEAENYVEAEQLAGQAKTAALDAETAASSAEETITAASASISAARDERRTVGLDTAEELLQQAEDAYKDGDYTGAKVLAEQAHAVASEATAPKKHYTWLALGVAFVTLVLAMAVLIFKRRIITVEEALGEVDLDALFEKHPNLRLDDREVIRFMAESGGEAFATEIRERFDIPRTSAWRMIRRLQREGIVEVKNIGGQSLVVIVSRYRMGGGGA